MTWKFSRGWVVVCNTVGTLIPVPGIQYWTSVSDPDSGVFWIRIWIEIFGWIRIQLNTAMSTLRS